MDAAQNLFETFTNNTDPKIIIVSAFEIKEHFSNVWNQEPKDEIGEEFLYQINAKNESFEWLILLTILQLNGVGYGEYFTSLAKREKSLTGEQCKWANLILKEIRPQMNDIFKVDCNDLIEVFEKVVERDLITKKETNSNEIITTSPNEKPPVDVNEQRYPDLLLIIHDKLPTNKSGFANSVINSLDYSMGPDTQIVTKQHNNAHSLDSVLPFALASAISHFEQYSLELDKDETIYSRFKSASSGQFIKGYSFSMFSKRNAVNLQYSKKKGFLYKLFNKDKSIDKKISPEISGKDSGNSKGNLQIISINEFHNFFLNLAKKLGITDPDIIFSKIGVCCERCNVQYTKDALEVLNISKMFGGARTVIMGATQEGNDLRSGKCPKCSHTKMSILIHN